jgi:hypothetical protein
MIRSNESYDCLDVTPEHDPFLKPASTFWDHALSRGHIPSRIEDDPIADRDDQPEHQTTYCRPTALSKVALAACNDTAHI